MDEFMSAEGMNYYCSVRQMFMELVNNHPRGSKGSCWYLYRGSSFGLSPRFLKT